MSQKQVHFFLLKIRIFARPFDRLRALGKRASYFDPCIVPLSQSAKCALRAARLGVVRTTVRPDPPN